MRLLNRIFCACLTVLMLSGVCFVGFAADAPASLTVACSNVEGLPIPALFSSRHKIVPAAEKKLGAMLNQSGTDVVCVQEDFQFHALLASQMTNYPYRTFTSGGIPVGDGLNVFSKYPIYNVERVAWDTFSGILTNDNDGLTPKGFLKCTLDVGGILIDLYDIHTDASKTMEDQLAKKAQFEQLNAYIDAHSAGRPVLITGDFNCTLHTYYYAEFYETMIDKAGFRDVWVETVNGGNYLRGDDAEAIIARYNAQYNDLFKGLWDSYERLVYRGAGGVAFTPTAHQYTFYTDRPGEPQALSDHAVMTCTLQISAQDYERPQTALRAPEDKPFGEKAACAFRMVTRCVRLILSDLFRLVRELF